MSVRLCKSIFLLLFFFSSWLEPLHSQSFDPGKMYQVPGAVLNRLEANLQTAKQELQTSKTANQELAKQNDEQAQRIKALSEQLAKESRDRLTDSQSKEEALNEVRRQLTTASAYLEQSRREAMGNSLLAGSVAFLAGTVTGWLIHR